MHTLRLLLLATIVFRTLLPCGHAADAPPNDQFSNAVELTGVDAMVSGSNVGATSEPGEPPAGGSAVHSVWWIWTPPTSGIVEIDTAGSSFDTVLSVFQGTRLPQLWFLASDDDGGPNFTSRVRISATGGIPLVLRVDGYAGATGGIMLRVRADTGIKIFAQPNDQRVAEGGSVRFSVGSSGPAPLQFQWLRDGEDLPGATNATLILPGVTSAQAGQYQVRIRNAFSFALSREARLTITTPAVVAFFADPTVVDVFNPAPDGEAQNLRTHLAALGHQVVSFTSPDTGLQLQPGVVLVLPKAEFADPSPALMSLIQLFVGNGGRVIVSDVGRWLSPLNSMFSWSLQTAFPQVPGLLGSDAAGTPFEDGPPLLPPNTSTLGLISGSLPPDSLQIYDAGGTVLVAAMPFGAGEVIWLGWDWYDGAPRGGQDGGWSRILSAAVERARFGANLPLPPGIFSHPGDRVLLPGETLELSVGAFGSPPMAYQWFQDAMPIQNATTAILRIPNVTTNTAGIYTVRVSNDLGTTNSRPAAVRVIPLGSLDFRILSLGSAGQTIEKGHILGDDRGGMAISSSRLFATGDSVTGHFDPDTLGNGASAGTILDGLVSELGLERAYVLANASGPAASASVDRLIRLHDDTGALTDEVISLSRPVDLSGGGSVYSGLGRCVLRNAATGATWDILIPSGVVRELPVTHTPDAALTENWANWGLVESFGGALHLVYVAQGNRIVRRQAGSPDASVLAQFENLGDMGSITASLHRQRWYFQFEGGAQFGAFSEALGFAEALFELGSPEAPPRFLTQPRGGVFPAGTSVTLSASGIPGNGLSYRGFRTGH